MGMIAETGISVMYISASAKEVIAQSECRVIRNSLTDFGWKSLGKFT